MADTKTRKKTNKRRRSASRAPALSQFHRALLDRMPPFYQKHRTLILDFVRPALIALVILILFLSLHHTNSMQNYGIDVSEYQGKIEWSEVADSGVSFAIIRCGFSSYEDGEIHKDDTFKRNMRWARFYAVHRGVYFRSNAITEEEAVEEAEFVLDCVGHAKLDYPIFIDVEDSNTESSGRADGLTVEERTAVVKAFCSTIEEAGYDAGVYSNAWYLANMVDPTELADYAFWVAEYVDGSTLSTWTGDWTLWQYTQEGEVDGIDGYVDLDRYPT